MLDGKDQLSCPRSIHLLQGEDVGVRTVAVLARDLDIGAGPSRRPRSSVVEAWVSLRRRSP